MKVLSFQQICLKLQNHSYSLKYPLYYQLNEVKISLTWKNTNTKALFLLKEKSNYKSCVNHK